MEYKVILAYILAVLNPLPLGLILGYALCRSKETEEIGHHIIMLSIILTIIYLIAVIGIRQAIIHIKTNI